MIYFLLFFTFFMGVGAYLANLSPYVLSHYPEHANSIFASTQLAGPVGAILAGYTTDKTKLLRAPLIIALCGFGVFQIMLFAGMSGGLTIAAAVFMRLFMSASGQLLTIACLEDGNDRFARSRTAGTIGFCVVQGLLYFVSVSTQTANIPPGSWAQFGSIFYFIALLLAFKTPVHRKAREKYFFRETFVYLLQPRFLAFFATSFVFYACYQLVDFYIGRFIEITHGIAYVYLGWGLSVVLEIGLMPFTASLFDRYHTRMLFVVSIVAGGLRFLLLATSETTGMPPHFSQILHGLHFTGYYAAAIFLLKSSLPDRLYGTGFALYSAFASSLGGVAGSLITTGMLTRNPTESGYAFVFGVTAVAHLFLIPVFLLMKLPDALQEGNRDNASSYALK
ncbi:MAG: MFS transporter [Leptospirales bacterium]|nr:MFS transporter [Leptospirales bacterium]